VTDLEIMRKRAVIIQTVRSFFIDRNYLEVDTPILAPHLIPESVITPFQTRFASPHRGSLPLYLVPSPELWMKRLLAEGSGSLFQIGHCFRNSEQIGDLHNPEFTMLEWYTVDADYMDSADRTDELLGALATHRTQGNLRPPARRMSMEEAFSEIGNIDLAQCSEIEHLREQVNRAGLVEHRDSDWQELFNLLFLDLIEPELPKDRPLILYDYPHQVTTLSKRKGQSPWCERWELYLNGVEVANCFSEETDRRRVEEFYRKEASKITDTDAGDRSDRAFVDIFDNGFPESSGVALGIDRLIMSLLGIKEIGGVIFSSSFAIFDQLR